MAQVVTGSLGLKQYTKDVPPGWRPYSYPLKEYKEYLSVWSKLTKLDGGQVGAAIVSRLEGAALKLALTFVVERPNPAGGTLIYKGADAVSLEAAEAEYDPQTGAVLVPALPSGAKLLIDRLTEVYFLDEQDMAWTCLDKFFSFSQGSRDFAAYLLEWDRLLDDARTYGGLQLNEVGQNWLFFSRSNLADKQLADLRLKVNGDLTRFREMVSLQLKISKSEDATADQARGYRQLLVR